MASRNVRVRADNIHEVAEKLGLMQVLRRLVKQGKKLDDITVDTLRAAKRRDTRHGVGGGGGGPRGADIKLDQSGKLHSPNPKLPDHVPKDWSRADLDELATDLRASIANRKAEQARLGENTPAGPAHRARIAEEERFLRRIEKILSGT